MSEDVLQSVIETENEINQQIEDERLRASLWLKRSLAEHGDWLATELSRLEKDHQNKLAEARTEANEKATAIVVAAKQWAESMLAADDRSLVAIVERHLIAILPERVDDRQDDQD